MDGTSTRSPQRIAMASFDGRGAAPGPAPARTPASPGDRADRAIAVTGGTGFLGRPLVAALAARGDRVRVLTRDPARAGDLGAGVELVAADLEAAGPWREAIAGCAAVVHLAGEPVAARRWDARVKQQIHDSRVEGTRGVVEAIAAAPEAARPRVLVAASGIDYYPFADAAAPGWDDDEDVTEDAPPGDTFLARVCRNWEAEAARAEALGVRVVRMRTGLVLGRGGGGLAKMAGPFRWFVGGRLGSGRQWVSWIHRDDAVAAYAAAIDDERWRGPVNLVAGSVRGAELARALGRALRRPSWLPVPAFAVRAAAGELAESLLHGRKAVPRRLEALGFAFRYPDLADALAASVP